MSYEILVLADMIEAFDLEQPKPGNETTAFIKRWRKKELELTHRASRHLSVAVHSINAVEIQNIRETKKYRDGTWQPPRRGPDRKPSKTRGDARVKGKKVAERLGAGVDGCVEVPHHRNVIW